MNPRALLIFAKEPQPGRVKTRMTPPWSPQEASELYQCFLQDTLRAALGVRAVDRYLFFTPRESRAFFQEIIPPGFVLVPQQGISFTERCAHSVSEAFARGHSQIVQIGTDTPQMQAHSIEEAFHALEDHDMGLGPAQDGGYYLLSLSRPAIEIYEGVVMGRDRVFKKMEANARSQSMKIQILPEWIDVDTHDALVSLERDAGITLGQSTLEFLSSRKSG